MFYTKKDLFENVKMPKRKMVMANLIDEGQMYQHIKRAVLVDENERSKIQEVFETNADYFSKNNKHHTKYILKLFNFYNKYFSGITLEFNKSDVECGVCQTTIIKLWSTIIYDVWERKII